MTFKKSYVPGILGSVLTLTVIMAAPVKAETKEETILNKTDWSTMAAANVEGYANIRSEANADSEIVGVLMPGYAVTVTEKGDEWSKISSNGVEGYIKNEYLVFGEEAKGQAEAILKVQQANADGIRAIKEAGADDAVLTLKSLEALGVLANGKATKIVVPSDLQGLASLATTFKGIVEEQKVPAGKEVQK